MRAATWLVLAGMGCSGESPTETERDPVTSKVPDAEALRSDAPGDRTTASPPMASGGINPPAMELQRQLFGDATDNQVFSPASITVAFAMLAAGATGETREELVRALNLPTDDGVDSLGALVRAWNSAGDDAPVALRVANRVWVDAALPVLPTYLASTRDHYGAEAQTLDLRGDSEASRQIINTWVADQTADRIQDLLAPGTLGPDSRLVLTNAVYFKADWAQPFLVDATADREFTTAQGEAVLVPTMFRSGSIPYAEVDGVRVAALPYRGDTIDFLVALPSDGDLHALEAAMTAEQVDTWVAATRPHPVDLWLPKFELNTTYPSLAAPMAALGVRRAFTDAAELDGISTAEGLTVSDAVHKAFILVDETGTEAAAATGLVMGATGAMMEPSIAFSVDRPFWFAVRERASGSLLFVGHVTDPRG